MNYKKLTREPVVHFIMLSFLILGGEHLLKDQKKEIVVSQEVQDFLFERYEDLTLTKLDDTTKRKLIEEYIQEEILINEAYKKNLDKGDSRIRQNLLRKMRGLIIGKIDVPTEQDALDFYSLNKNKFINPKSYDIKHVFYRNKEDLPKDKNLIKLTDGDSHSDIGNIIRTATIDHLSRSFGKQVAIETKTAPIGEWIGPIESEHGFHYINVSSVENERILAFEEVKSKIMYHWPTLYGERKINDEINKQRLNYNIKIESMN